MIDMITLFNRLTNIELVDCNSFEKMLSNHYEKFKYFYYLIENLSKEEVERITCTIEDDELIFNTKFSSAAEAKKYHNTFTDYLLKFEDDRYRKYLTCSIFITSKKNLSIVIRNRENYKMNESIHSDRYKYF